jgi:hypothetical protein
MFPRAILGRDHGGARTYPLIAWSSAGTPTMFKTRVRLERSVRIFVEPLLHSLK